MGCCKLHVEDTITILHRWR